MAQLKNKVTKEITMMWGVRHKFEIKIRAGRAVRNETSHGEKLPDGEYFLEDIPMVEKPPYTSFPIDSFYRHDAIHYGIRLNESQVQDG